MAQQQRQQQQETEPPLRTQESNILKQLGEGPVMFQQQFIGVVMTKKGLRFVRYATSPNHKKCFANKMEPIDRINNFLKTLVQEQIPYDILLHIQDPFERMSVWTWVPLHDISELSLEVLWNMPGRATLDQSRPMSPMFDNETLDRSNKRSMRLMFDNVLTPDVMINRDRLLIRCTTNANPLNRYAALAAEVLLHNCSSQADTGTKMLKPTPPKVNKGHRTLRKCGLGKTFTHSSGHIKSIRLSSRGSQCIKRLEIKRPKVHMAAALMSSPLDKSPEPVGVIDALKKNAVHYCALDYQKSCVNQSPVTCSISGTGHEAHIVANNNSPADSEHVFAEAQGKQRAPDISTGATHDPHSHHPASDVERHPLDRLRSMCELM